MENTNKEIFDLICDYITSPDFQLAQQNFIDQHKAKFTDQEENKLEWTPIHEGYIFIMEQMIDLKVTDGKHTEDQLAAFYEHFKTNYADYKAQNEEAMQTLLDFLDFNKFKANMIEFKKIMDKDEAMTNLADKDEGQLEINESNISK